MNTVLYPIKQPGVNYIEAEPDDVCTCMALLYTVIYIIIGENISRSGSHWKLPETVVLYYIYGPVSIRYAFIKASRTATSHGIFNNE